MNSKQIKKNHSNVNEKHLNKEIKGLITTEYDDESENCTLQIYEDNDSIIHIITIDYDMDIYYEWIIEPGQKGKLLIGSPFNITNLELYA